jgi:hypothetical protein
MSENKQITSGDSDVRATKKKNTRVQKGNVKEKCKLMEKVELDERGERRPRLRFILAKKRAGRQRGGISVRHLKSHSPTHSKRPSLVVVGYYGCNLFTREGEKAGDEGRSEHAGGKER